jgi:integrase
MELDNVGLKDLSEAVLLRFFSSLQNSREYVCVPVCRFVRHLHLEGLLEEDLSIRFSAIKSHRAEKVPSYYSNEEIRKMDAVIERNSPTGKRNYAMFLLASRLGMRSSDIRSLQFGNIDWDRNVLVFKQQKTKKEIELPLFANIGEAIIDYIRNGRPRSNDKTIFLRTRAPFIPLTTTILSVTISDIICRAGIETKGRRHGSHSLRHSLATNLLKHGTTLPVISQTLGHSNTESTMIYLNVDVENLLRCSIDVPPVPDNFYMQKGGWFYV